MTILASIILSSYNSKTFIIAAVESALNQDYEDFEVIVVDDGSTDGSLDLLRAIRDSRLKVLTKQNEGQASAMNVGFEESSGETVFFMDGDDLSYSHRIRTVLLDLAEHPEAIGVMHSLEEIDVQGIPRLNSRGKARMVRARPPEVKGDILDLYFLLRATGARHLYTVTSGLAYRRRILENIFPLPTENWRTCPDHLLISLAAYFGPVFIEDRILGAYRIHGKNNLFLVDEEKLSVQLKQDVERYGETRGFTDNVIDLSRNLYLRRGRYYRCGKVDIKDALAILEQIRSWPGLRPQERFRQMVAFAIRNAQMGLKRNSTN
jgi:glycosyltransferase involved in cell wall biosynthesis